MPVDPEICRTIGEGEGDLGETHRFARIGAVENDIGHFATTKRLGRLLAEHPADGVENIGLTAAVGPDDGSYAFVEIEDSFISKRFKPKKLERFEMHQGEVCLIQ